MSIAKSIERGATAAAVLAGLVLLAPPGSAARPSASASAAGTCGVLANATPGLEVLCVNYCEKRDCPNSDRAECERLLANYDRHRRAGDPEMPCLAADSEALSLGGDSVMPRDRSCPCFTTGDLRNFPVELTWCIQEVRSDFIFSAIMGDFEADGAGAASNFRVGLYDCGYAVFSLEQKIRRFGGFSLTPEEAAACHSLIDAAIAERGLTCRSL